MNPELRRNLWLEVTPVRLALMPAILAGVFFLAYVSDERRLGETAGSVALVAFALLTWFWGAHLASESVLAELRGRTWDWQRMSGLGPWALAWGKLAGATAYPWYGGVRCLAVYLAADLPPGTRSGWLALVFVLAAILSQATTLFAALHAAGRGRVASRAQSSAYLLVAAVGIYPFVSFVWSSRSVRWYRLELPALEFAAASLACFAAFAVAGAWTRMRRELRVRTVPLVWPAFVVFAMGWAAGFGAAEARAAAGAAVLVAFVVAVGLTWATALVDRKDPVALRRLARALRERGWRRAAEAVPPWLLALPLALLPWLVLLARPGIVAEAGPEQWEVRLTATAVVLFLARDLALLLHVNLGARPRRADLFAVVLFLVGYVLVPLVLTAVEWKPLAALFFPDPARAPWSAAGALLQAGVVTGLLARRWRAREQTVAAARGG